MFQFVAQGFGRRLAFVRGLANDEWDIDARGGPDAADVKAVADLIVKDPGALVPLTAQRLESHDLSDMSGDTVLARILGREHGAGGGVAIAAILASGPPDRSGGGEVAGWWRLVGQATLDASVGLPLDERFWGAPALPCEGVGDLRRPDSELAAHLDDFLRHTATDRGALLRALGVTRAHAEILGEEDLPTFGGFVAGLLEGTSGVTFAKAASRALETGSLSDAGAFPLAVAAHLAVQVIGTGPGFDLPGFGPVKPRMPIEPMYETLHAAGHA